MSEQNDFQRRVLLEQHRREQSSRKAQSDAQKGNGSPFDIFKEFLRSCRDMTACVWNGAKPVAYWLYDHTPGFCKTLLRWTWKGAKLAGSYGLWMCTKKDANGVRHFSGKRLALNVAASALLATTGSGIMTGAYYYGTVSTYANVYIPNAGVFQSQQFEKANDPHVTIPKLDEIYTVLGKHVDEEDKPEPIRFDIDANMFFFFWEDAMRPDHTASKLDSQSPYGLRCDLVATGIYNRIPRFMRQTTLFKWLNLRPEIVKVSVVTELTEMPPFALQLDKSDIPASAKPLRSGPMP